LAVALVVTLTGIVATTPGAQAEHSSSTVRVGAVNAREGSLVRQRMDLRTAHDRDALARRMLSRPGGTPDVVLLQEVLGRAGKMRDALNRAASRKGLRARYAVATSTYHRFVAGSCRGPRSGRFSLLRSSAVLVDTGTVSAVHARGELRTWGRWGRKARGVVKRRGHGCAAHPWVHLTVEQPGRAPTTALASSVHVAPLGRKLKNNAVRHLQRGLDALADRVAADVRVVGGDLNLTRCAQRLDEGERRSCRPRRGLRSLLGAGYADAVRSRHVTGPNGVVGVARRIDFLYATGTVTAAWHDRCYMAFHVRRWKCGPDRAVFATSRKFHRCQTRALRHGRPGGGCSPAQYRRYYSDHKILLATLSRPEAAS